MAVVRVEDAVVGRDAGVAEGVGETPRAGDGKVPVAGERTDEGLAAGSGEVGEGRGVRRVAGREVVVVHRPQEQEVAVRVEPLDEAGGVVVEVRRGRAVRAVNGVGRGGRRR